MGSSFPCRRTEGRVPSSRSSTSARTSADGPPDDDHCTFGWRWCCFPRHLHATEHRTLRALLCFTKAVNLRSTNSFCLSKYHKGCRNITGGVCSASAHYKSDGRFLRLKKTQAGCLQSDSWCALGAFVSFLQINTNNLCDLAVTLEVSAANQLH